MSAASELAPRLRAATTLVRFPVIVWTHPLLAPLDARSRAELESAGELRALADGDALFATGDSADAIFVVVRGEIALRSGARTAELRRVGPGEAAGEEAAARAHATRRHDARAVGACEVAALPAPLLRRVMERSAASEAGRPAVHDWARRWLVRALAKDALERADFARDVTARDRDRMLDGGRAIELRRGETLFREGDDSSDAYFLGEGIVRVGSGEDKRILAYHKAGDFFGDEAIAGEPRDATATATSDAWIFAVRADLVREIARDNDAAFAKALRIQTAARAKQREIRENATRHVLADLHRFETSRSLLAIDQERCIRCGHCAWSCSSAHDDGVSRLLRRGDVVVAKMRGQARTLLLPSSCQHCKNPACMIDCPTGAITRDARGEVHIREELCTGCGSCAKACPWDNVQMAPAKRRLTIVQASAQVAVKCDLCHERAEGPACVSACPVDAIVRIDPSVELDEVRAVLDKRAPRSVDAPKRSLRAASIVCASAMLASGAFFALDGSPRAGGLVLLALFAALAFYAIVKRVLRWRVRPHFVAHLAVGTASLGVAAAHVRGHSALALAFWGAALLGLAAGALGAIVPKRLARIERKAMLPEELGGALRDLDARVFREVSGTSDLLKGLWVRLLEPFSRSPLVLVTACIAATSQRAMREALVARVRAITSADDERLAGLDRLASIAVERQALRAQRVLVAGLRGVAFAHVVVVCALAVLVVLHVIAEVRAW